MSFLETVERARAALERNQRVSLEGLKREFDLDDQTLDQLVSELADVQQVAAREGKILSWIRSARPRALPAGPEDQPAARAERRQLTVMFCDLVGSTALSERLDAEDLRDVLRAYQDSAAHAIAHYEGHIAQYLGDGLLVYFGFPRAQEDDAERAVYAALALLRGLDGLNEELETDRGIRLAVRIGIHTGPVVVGEVGDGESRETQAHGATTNIAARLTGVAEPGTVVVSRATLRLASGRFQTRDLGTPTLKGVTEPIRAFAVLHSTAIRTRFDVDPARLTPLVGRDRELGLLLDCWNRAKQGERNAVLVSGEAGVGKSRLFRTFGERIADDRHIWIECQCARYTRGSAFQPLVEFIERVAGLDVEDSAEEKLHRLEGVIERAGLSIPEVVPLFASLLSLPASERFPPLEFSAEIQYRRTLEALHAWVLALARKQPLLMLVEDLQWCDRSTLEFLALLLDPGPDARMLVLLSFRSDFEPALPVRSHLERLLVSRFDTREARMLIGGMTRERPLPRELQERIVERADGIPLFLEELTKMVLESGLVESSEKSGQPVTLAIPATLQDSLMARLDRLGGGKEVARLGAVLGREFSYELLRAVSEAGDAELAAGLQALIDAELLLANGTPPLAVYGFWHALIQETAYQSLLRSERRRVHALIANALVERFPKRAETEPDVVARHYDEAGMSEEAIAYYKRAAQRAKRRFANEDAIAYLRRALQILGTLPSAPERDRQELALQLAIGAPLYVSRGWANAEYGQSLERSRELAAQLGNTAELFGIWMGLYFHHQFAGELAKAEDFARRALALARPKIGHVDNLLALSGLSQTLYLQGRFDRAFEYIEQIIKDFYSADPEPEAGAGSSTRLSASLSMPSEDRHGGRHHLPSDGGAASALWGVRALCRWALGYPHQALALCAEALESARRHGSPFNLASALIYAGWIHQRRREPGKALIYAQEACALCEQHRFSWLSWALVLRGSASVYCGAGDLAIADVQRGIDSLQSTGTKGWLPHCFAVLAEICLQLERLGDALHAVDAGLECAAQTRQRYDDSQLLWLRGEILSACEGDQMAAAEQTFQAAIETARGQQARSLELRAATSLACIWRKQGRHAQARALLAPVQGWFSEGFDTRDWIEANELLEHLT